MSENCEVFELRYTLQQADEIRRMYDNHQSIGEIAEVCKRWFPNNEDCDIAILIDRLCCRRHCLTIQAT
jgi:hypothetical protein